MFSLLASRLWALALLLALALAACSSDPTRASSYTVKRGDTLYAIAWKHKLDYRDIARWNGIGAGYVIHPGQVLRLYPPNRHASSTAAAVPRATESRPVAAPIQWQWPVQSGRAQLTSRPNGGHGLTIGGQLGEEIRAAGAGRVVYKGAGLLGYGQLVIIKHNEIYLSAYGHTRDVAVIEGQAVSAGQRIATMGSGPQDAPMLYFEIRMNGAPTNPLTLLPHR
jgi:lipoprotein NlpD